MSPSGSTRTAATSPPLSGRFSAEAAGVSVISSSLSSAPAGIASVKRVPSAAVAVTVPPAVGTVAVTAREGSSTTAGSVEPVPPSGRARAETGRPPTAQQTRTPQATSRKVIARFEFRECERSVFISVASLGRGAAMWGRAGVDLRAPGC
jgi:hypothetical protein